MKTFLLNNLRQFSLYFNTINLYLKLAYFITFFSLTNSIGEKNYIKIHILQNMKNQLNTETNNPYFTSIDYIYKKI